MKNRLLPIILIVSSTMAFFSCEKETLTAELSTTPTVNQPVQVIIQEEVLFQYDYQNESTGEYFGWLIDKEGVLKSYISTGDGESDHLPGGDYCLKSNIHNLLYQATTTHLTLSEEELLKYYRMIGKASTGSLSEALEDESQQAIVTFRAYDSEIVMEGADGCGPQSTSTHPSGADVGERVYNLITLKLEGALNQENARPEAKTIVNWMKGLHDSAGL